MGCYTNLTAYIIMNLAIPHLVLYRRRLPMVPLRAQNLGHFRGGARDWSLVWTRPQGKDD